MSRLEKILLLINLLTYTFLFIFSYSYVDLNLTLSQNLVILKFVILMQQLGYYNRTSAALTYLALIIFTFSFFILNLWFFYRSKIGLKYLKISTVANTLVLIFAYPFLSYDLFNYMFWAIIIINYHANPYTHRPLDFPNDEWLRFMRWVHSYYPYGPLWLLYSLIPATLGFGKFVLNLLTFKVFISIFHLINSYLIYKILGRINSKYRLTGTAFYSLNPTLLIEGVVNGHNDVALASFMLGSIYFLIYNKKVLSALTLIAGALVKYIPVLVAGWLFRESVSVKKNIERYIKWSLATMIVFTFFYSSIKINIPLIPLGSTQVQFQPWYLFWTIPLVVLIPRITLLMLAGAVCFGASLRYLPYLYYGDWSHPGTTLFMQGIVILPAILATGALLIKKYFKV